MKSKFGEGKNLLFGYILPEKFLREQGYEHNDPMISEFTYGDHGKKGEMIRNGLGVGNYVFFHTTIGGHRYITGYYVISKIMEGYEARSEPSIVKNYKNPHFHYPEQWHELGWGEWIEEGEDVVIFGAPDKSKDLRKEPLLFDRNLAEKLGFEGSSIVFDVVDKNGRLMKDSERISSSTRTPRYITDNDVELLLKEMDVSVAAIETSNGKESTTLENEESLLDIELSGFAERDIEDLIYSNPSCLDDGLELLARQHVVPSGRIDLLAQDRDGNIIVIEIKKETPRDDVLAQVLSYVKYVRREYPDRKVLGGIVCKDCSKRLYDAAEDAGVRIYYYGAKFSCDRVV